jgi:AcrR family transcriptional regulator
VNRRSAEKSKENILAAARTVFAEHGYAQASMRIIARAAGISVGGLYLYFRNKEELYLTFMQEWMKNLNDRTQDALREIDNPSEAIAAFITLTIHFSRSNKEMIILQGRELGFSFGLDLKRAFFRERRKQLADIVRRGVESGLFRPCDAEEVAKVIFNILRGFIISMVIDEDALFTPEESVNLVLNGLLRRNSG